MIIHKLKCQSIFYLFQILKKGNSNKPAQVFIFVQKTINQEKKALGRLAHINGKRAVAFVDKDNQIRAYTTVDEINDMF